MVRILFVCGKARARSPTAADLAGRCEGVEADFAGLSHDADEPLSPEQIAWADVVAVMERTQLARLNRIAGSALARKRVTCLDVPDRFAFMQPELVTLLQDRLKRLIPG
ncbi:MAG: phosphotyrosine protein phosphatase [Roseivivax sp.]|nr:phosphotyrosine protein phosphatase [Roseivivax sp.]